MSDLSSPPTVDTATRFQHGDKVRVTIDCTIDESGFLEPLYTSYLYGHTGEHLTPATVTRVYGGATVTPIDSELSAPRSDLPAPYSEPREGDRLEVQRPPICGVVAMHHGRPYLEVDGGGSLAINDFAVAVAEGRVRLVKAAAPTFEPGRIYRSESTDTNYLHAPGGTNVWFKVDDEPGWFTNAEVPADLVPCDVVPREATP